MASDALWIVSFKCVVKGYQKCHFDVKDGEVLKVLKKIGKSGCAFRIANEHGQLGHLQCVLFYSVLLNTVFDGVRFPNPIEHNQMD